VTHGYITTLVAVKDLGEAMAFNEGKLHLARTDESTGWAQYRSGTSGLILYESELAGKNKATTAVWTVGDVHHSGAVKMHGSKIPLATSSRSPAAVSRDCPVRHAF
jgi:hypothetical protein